MPPASASDFGGECFKPDGCNGNSPDWPDCSNAQCSTGDCAFPVFTSDYGYCTRSCTQDYQCENGAGPYGSDFTCLTDGTNGICAPGSNQRCDYGLSEQCENPDEVCKYALIYAPDSFYGAVCQPRTPEGAEVFGECNESEGRFCANDMCISGICTTFCDPEAEEDMCPTGFRCFDDWYLFGQTVPTISMSAYPNITRMRIVPMASLAISATSTTVKTFYVEVVRPSARTR